MPHFIAVELNLMIVDVWTLCGGRFENRSPRRKASRVQGLAPLTTRNTSSICFMSIIIRKFEPQRTVALIEAGLGEQPASSSSYVVVGDSIEVDEQVNYFTMITMKS